MNFSGFFDDAALFPPGDAPMNLAVPAHRALRARLGDLVGPFVVPAARLGSLAACLGDDEPPFGVSVIAAPLDLPPALATVRAHPVLALAAVEVPLIDDVERAVSELAGFLPASVPVAVELPRTSARDAVLEVLARRGYRAKLRTGGVVPEAFPSPEELGAALAACRNYGVAFKCTAGLHHAVRHTDPATGFTHHGFLNILVATDALAEAGGSRAEAAAPAGAGGEPAEAWLRETDAARLAAAVRAWSPARAARARASFTSFGTCSITEPVDDLVALGLVRTPERAS